jgi:predicted pyridoxine 5'-phosphate oxidase superfamily flavin-nucleotide-binding protein
VRITGPTELAFPDYDGNGMFKSMGNLSINPNVGLLFIALHGRPRRMRVSGTARIELDDPLLATTVGAQLIVRVAARAIFPNCPRYIPSMQVTEESRFIPRAGEDFVEPGWKGDDAFCDVIHPRAETFGG